MQTPYVTDISPGVRLSCVKTDKFKTGTLSMNLVTPLARETAALSALLPRVLRRGTASLPDMQSIAEALDEQYGARIEPNIRKKGELHCPGLFADFPDDSFLPTSGGGGILEKTAAMMGEMLLSPALDGGLFRVDYVKSERKNLIDDIRAIINDKRGYAVYRLFEEMCADEAYGVHSLGREPEAAAIMPATLTEHYRKLLASAKIEAFYCGSAEPERVENAVRAALKDLPERDLIDTPKTNVIFAPKTGDTRKFTEEMNVAQGKLTLGFRIGNAMEDPDYPALMVFNAVYGGSVTSKLFLNVREKLSLCYYASSMLEKHKGLMIVSSGVEFSKFGEARSEILAQLENVKTGDISDWELESARRAVVTAIKSALDRPAGLEDLYFDSSLAAGRMYPPDELCERASTVSRGDVARIASGVKLDSVYFLTGKGGDGNEA